MSRSLTTITVIPLAFVLYVSKFVKRSNAHPCKPLLPRSPQFRGLPVSPSSRMPSRLPTAIVPTPRSTHSDSGCGVSEYQADVNAALNIADRHLSGESHSREYTSGDDSAEEGGRLTVPQDSQAVDESQAIRSHTRNLRFLGTMLTPSKRRLERMRLETNRPLRSA